MDGGVGVLISVLCQLMRDERGATCSGRSGVGGGGKGLRGGCVGWEQLLGCVCMCCVHTLVEGGLIEDSVCLCLSECVSVCVFWARCSHPVPPAYVAGAEPRLAKRWTSLAGSSS